jgi:hypothetical protein
MLQFLALLSTQFKGVLFHSLSVSSYYLIQLLIFISGGLTRGKVSFGDYPHAPQSPQGTLLLASPPL